MTKEQYNSWEGNKTRKKRKRFKIWYFTIMNFIQNYIYYFIQKKNLKNVPEETDGVFVFKTPLAATAIVGNIREEGGH